MERCLGKEKMSILVGRLGALRPQSAEWAVALVGVSWWINLQGDQSRRKSRAHTRGSERVKHIFAWTASSMNHRLLILSLQTKRSSGRKRLNKLHHKYWRMGQCGSKCLLLIPKCNLVQQLKKGSGFFSTWEEAAAQGWRKPAGADAFYFEAKPDFSDYSTAVCQRMWLIIYLAHHYGQILFLSNCCGWTQNKQPPQSGWWSCEVGLVWWGQGIFPVLFLVVSLVSRNYSAGEGRGHFMWLCGYVPLAATWFFLILHLDLGSNCPLGRLLVFQAFLISSFNRVFQILLEKEDFLTFFFLPRFSC